MSLKEGMTNHVKEQNTRNVRASLDTDLEASESELKSLAYTGLLFVGLLTMIAGGVCWVVL